MSTFTWPLGSKHIVQVLNDLPSDQAGNNCPANFAKAVQVSVDQGTALLFNGWKDNLGLLTPSSDPVQTITAMPGLTSLIAGFTLSFKVTLNVFQGQPNSNPLFCQPAGGTPGAPPPDQLRPGVAYVDGVGFWNSAIVYVTAGTHILNAFPYPGFTFDGWSINGSPSSSYLGTVDVEAAIVLTPLFRAAKRVRFITNPMGLNVLVDRTQVPTTPQLFTGVQQTCPGQYTRPPLPPPGVPPLCFGDFDFAPGSTHVIGAPSPQRDIAGKLWVFDSWASGGGENTTYTAGSDLSVIDMPVANFVQGAAAYFSTVPANLPLTIDGRNNWPYPPVFSWAIGSTHTVSATPTITDSKGRKYTFNKWSNTGAATQQVTVAQADVDNGLRMIANYDVLSRLVVQATSGSVTIQVDGTPCPAPCYVDRPNGSQIRVTVPASVAVSDGTRVDFMGWSDNGANDHVVTLNGDTQTITANYQTMFRLTTSSAPSGGASFQMSPSAGDSYYPAGQPVTVVAASNPGFKFLRWGGDWNGTYPSANIMMSQPCNLVAQLGVVPYIAPAGVQNGAGATPDQVVAPGSIISILGASLTSTATAGPTNPLAQTINGIVVTVANRFLPLISVSPSLISAQLPGDLSEGSYTLTVSATGQPDVTGTFTVARNAPGLFTWSTDSRPIALATHQDGTPVTPGSPAIPGETVTVYGTGFGPAQQPMVAGFLLPNSPPNPLIDALTINLDVLNPATTFAGVSTTQIGMEVFTFTITPDIPAGNPLNLSVTVNGRTSNTVLLPL